MIFFELFTKIPFQKWHVKVIIVINGYFKLETIALLDTRADMNCLQEV